MIKYKVVLAVPTLLAAAGLILAGGSASAGESRPSADERFFAAVAANPTDFAGLDRLSMRLYGTHYYVAIGEGGEEVTGTNAASALGNWQDQAEGDVGILATLPTDTFTITIGRATVSTGVYVTGSVVFKSTYAGQLAPTDVASLQFSVPACVTLNNHSITTHNQSGSSTNLGYLSDANVGAKSPIWRINDYVSGFSNQAHRSAASVLIKKVGCSGTQSVSTAYRYEHNQSSAIVNISASFGALSVGYNSSTLNLQKSSSVLNFTF